MLLGRRPALWTWVTHVVITVLVSGRVLSHRMPGVAFYVCAFILAARTKWALERSLVRRMPTIRARRRPPSERRTQVSRT